MCICVIQLRVHMRAALNKWTVVFHTTSGTASPVDINVKLPRCPKKGPRGEGRKGGGIPPRLHNLGTGQKCVVSFTYIRFGLLRNNPPPTPTLNFDLMSQKWFCPMELLKWDDELCHRADTPINCQQNTLRVMFLYFRVQCWDTHISTPVKKHAFSSNLSQVDIVCRFY
jgi:hypothetical protein